MTCLTAEQITESHYIPANNMFAGLLAGGEKGARKILNEYVEYMRNNAEVCPVCRNAFADWYSWSCELLIADHKLGKPVAQNYPPFVLPAH